MAKIPIHIKIPKVMGDIRVYAVQYRNYPDTIHVQGAGAQRGRHYGFAFDIPGYSDDVTTRYLPSLAGTSQVYWPGALVINGTMAVLVGTHNQTFSVPIGTLPEGV